jgi:small subunit ribosomal protein S8
MTMTDPIADMLTRIRNANTALHDTVTMPSSKLKENLARLLAREGYVGDVRVEDASDRPERTLKVGLKYSSDRARTISGLRRISKPGLRVYCGADEIPRVYGGLGIAVLSTSQGLMTDREARRRRMGGEILCYVW